MILFLYHSLFKKSVQDHVPLNCLSETCQVFFSFFSKTGNSNNSSAFKFVFLFLQVPVWAPGHTLSLLQHPSVKTVNKCPYHSCRTFYLCCGHWPLTLSHSSPTFCVVVWHSVLYGSTCMEWLLQSPVHIHYFNFTVLLLFKPLIVQKHPDDSLLLFVCLFVCSAALSCECIHLNKLTVILLE